MRFSFRTAFFVGWFSLFLLPNPGHSSSRSGADAFDAKGHKSVQSKFFQDLAGVWSSRRTRPAHEGIDAEYHDFALFNHVGRKSRRAMVLKYNPSSCYPEACLNLLESRFGRIVYHLNHNMAMIDISAEGLEEALQLDERGIHTDGETVGHLPQLHRTGGLEVLDYGPVLPSLKVDDDLMVRGCGKTDEDRVTILASLLSMTKSEHDEFLIEARSLLANVLPQHETIVLESEHVAKDRCSGCWLYARWKGVPCGLSTALVTALAGMRQVASLHREYPAITMDVWAKGVVETGKVFDAPLTLGAYASWLDGEGEVVGMLDTGIDTQSCFFRDDEVPLRYQRSSGTLVLNPRHRKIMQYISVGSDSDTFDNDEGHGTHNAGLIAGKCLGTNPDYQRFDGIVPNAKLAIFDANRAVASLTSSSISVPSSLGAQVFSPMYEAGSRIFSNGWGFTVSWAGGGASYTAYSSEVDEFMYEHPDALILFSVGSNGLHWALKTVSPPSTAKSALSIGASANDYESWGFRDQSFFGRQVSSDSLMGYSSLGPTNDNRLKPDLIAPGSILLSAKAQFNSSEGHCSLQESSGTSAAVSVAAGYAVKVRQYFTKGYYPSGSASAKDAFVPSGALLKAMLVHSGTALTRLQSVDLDEFLPLESSPLTEYPSIRQGFGVIQLRKVLHFAQASSDPVNLVVWGGVNKYNDSLLTSTSLSWTRSFTVDGKSDIRITLAYTDYYAMSGASNPMVNYLTIVCRESSSVYTPHVASGTTSSGGPVQVIDIPRSALVAGQTLTITVSALVLSRSPQPFAVVVTGATTFLPSSPLTACEAVQGLPVSQSCSCPPGHGRSRDSSYRCQSCPARTYSENDVCVACPAGTISGSSAATSRAECLFVLPSYGISVGILLVTVGVTLVYFVYGRLYYVIWTRRLLWSEAAVVTAGSLIFLTDVISTVHMLLLRSHARGTGPGTSASASDPASVVSVVKQWLDFCKTLAFLLVSVLIMGSTMLLVLLRCMLRVLFGSMIIWRGYKLEADLPVSFSSLFARLVGFVDSVFGVPLYQYLLYPFTRLIDVLAVIQINFSVSPVNCTGSQASVFLLVNVVVIACVAILIASEVQVYWRGALATSALKVLALDLNPTYTSRMAHYCLGNTLAALTALLVPQPLNLLQYLIGFVSILRPVAWQSSDICDAAYPVPWDTIIGRVSAGCALFSAMPIIFVIGQVIVPRHQRRRCDSHLDDGKEPRPAEAAEAAEAAMAVEGVELAVVCEADVEKLEERDPMGKCRVRCAADHEHRVESALSSVDGVDGSCPRAVATAASQSASTMASVAKSCCQSLAIDLWCHDLIAAVSARLSSVHASFLSVALPELIGKLSDPEDASWTRQRTLQRLHDVAEVVCATELNVASARATIAAREACAEESQQVDSSPPLDDAGPPSLELPVFRQQFLSYREAMTRCEEAMASDAQYLWEHCGRCLRCLRCLCVVPNLMRRVVCGCLWVCFVDEHAYSLLGMLRTLALAMAKATLYLPIVQLGCAAGRAMWTAVGRSFAVVLMLSLGIWTDEMEASMHVVETQAYYNELLSHEERRSIRKVEEQRQEQALHSSSLGGRLRWKKIDVVNMYQLQDEFDEEKERFRSLLASLVAPRVLLIQIVPWLTLWSVLATSIADCPIFVFSSAIEARLPPLVETDPLLQAYKILHRMDYPFALPPLWKALIVALKIFLSGRLIQFGLAVYAVLVMVLVVFESAQLLTAVYVLVALYLVVGLSDALYAMLLIHRYMFPVPQSELRVGRNESVRTVDWQAVGDDDEGNGEGSGEGDSVDSVDNTSRGCDDCAPSDVDDRGSSGSVSSAVDDGIVVVVSIEAASCEEAE